MAMQARIDRQAVLRKPDPPLCEFFVHEHGLREMVGSRRIMSEQLLHLVFLAARQQYDIRVVPASTGPHGVWGSFMLMGYDTHGPVVFAESLTQSLFLEKPKDITAYRNVLKRLDEDALDAGQSREWLALVASEFEQPEDGPDERS
jgi:hypothetical protein